MKKEEFKAKFEGKKVKDSGPNGWFIPVIFEDDQWWGIDHRKKVVWDFCDKSEGYQVYKEPEPTFDWEAEGFWVVYKTDDLASFMEKISRWTWVRHNKNGVVGSYSKEEIIKHYSPCLKPDNASDYGVDE